MWTSLMLPLKSVPKVDCPQDISVERVDKLVDAVVLSFPSQLMLLLNLDLREHLYQGVWPR